MTEIPETGAMLRNTAGRLLPDNTPIEGRVTHVSVPVNAPQTGEPVMITIEVIDSAGNRIPYLGEMAEFERVGGPHNLRVGDLVQWTRPTVEDGLYELWYGEVMARSLAGPYLLVKFDGPTRDRWAWVEESELQARGAIPEIPEPEPEEEP